MIILAYYYEIRESRIKILFLVFYSEVYKLIFLRRKMYMLMINFLFVNLENCRYWWDNEKCVSYKVLGVKLFYHISVWFLLLSL